MSQYDCDVVVIGGGIHGVGVAQSAAAAGYQVAVLEQEELASGTSSRSSKLIHGGLRYLESGQFSVVRECLHEREILLKLAPELVNLVPFYIPIYRETSRRPWTIRSGLMLYSTLAGFAEGSGFRKVPRSEWQDLDGIKQEGLQAVYQYWDGQTDDAALTRAVMASAQSLGAKLYQPAQFQNGEITEDGATIDFTYQGESRSIKARILVNAAGPWVNHVLEKVSPRPFINPIDLVQGTHLVLDMPLNQGVYYMEAPADKRAIFAIPWQGKTMLGTTENHYLGDPAAVTPLEGERHYLLESFCHYFPQYRNALPDEVSSFAGLRVLPQSDEHAFGRSRETLLLWGDDHCRLLSVYGGKLTAYRATAERVLAMLMKVLPSVSPVAKTSTLPLSLDVNN